MNTLHNSFFHLAIIYWVTNRYQILFVGFRDAMGNKTEAKASEQGHLTNVMNKTRWGEVKNMDGGCGRVHL